MSPFWKVFFILVILGAAKLVNANCDGSLNEASSLRTSLIGIESKTVTPNHPTKEDYKATLFQDGYQLVTDLPKLEGITETELYEQLSKVVKSHEVLFFSPQGKFYQVYDSKDVVDVTEQTLNTTLYVKEVELPFEFSQYLSQRFNYLKKVNEPIENDYEIRPTVEIRVGNFIYAPTGFHVDTGDGYALGETLNRGNNVHGTYVVGANGHIFETGANESLLFATDEFKYASGPEHAAPPGEDKRVFLRIGVVSKHLSSRMSHLTKGKTRYIDQNGILIFEK